MTESETSVGEPTPAAKEPAETLALRASPRPVVRLHRRNLMLVAAIGGLVILGAIGWGLRPPAAGLAEGPAAPARVERVPRPEGLSALPRDYASLPPVLGAPVGELGRPVVRAEAEAGLEPAPPADSYWPDPAEDAARSARLQDHDEAMAAAKGPVFFPLAQRQPQAEAAVKPVAEEGTRGEAVESVQAPADPTAQSAKWAFLDRPVDPVTAASGSLEGPRSPYQVMAGTVIPAALLTGINADLPGQILATVTGNVYDTVSGEHLLIPQGARLLGQYDSQVAAGQQRVLLVWTRLLLPDGSSLLLDRLPGVDPAGYAGLQDGVDRHWQDVFTGAVLATLIGINTELAASERTGEAGSIVIAARDSAQDTVNEVGQQLTRRSLNRPPTLTVRPGYPVRVIVNRDLVLRPYRTTGEHSP